MHVVFVNPGHNQTNNPTGGFWPEAGRFAEAVALDLGIRLEILYAGRSSFTMQSLVTEVINRQQKPDYLLLVNERFALNPLFAQIDAAGIPFFLAYNHFSKTLDRQPLPRQQYRHWLGSLLPDNEYAGYQLAEHLLHSLPDGEARLLAYSGDDITSASTLRVKGLMRAVANHPGARLEHIEAGDWRYDTPLRKTPGLLRRYPQVNAIWAANGAMAMGVLAALRKHPDLPEINLASINWDADEVAALEEGSLFASVGGHFMTAGWSLIMLYDYHHGLDFKDDGGLYQQRRLFEAVTRNNIKHYLPILHTRQWRNLNYRSLSKVYNSERPAYQFSLGQLLDSKALIATQGIDH